MRESLATTARRIASVAQELVGAQRWVIYSVGPDGHAGEVLWAQEDERRCAAYFSGYHLEDPLAPHRIAATPKGVACLSQRLASGADPQARYRREFMQPYALSDALDMLLPVNPSMSLGVSLLRDAPHPGYSRTQVQALTDFYVLASQLLALQEREASPETGARARLAQRCPQLTGRELDIALAVAGGMPNKLAARHAGMSPSTVKTHLHSIFRKCGIANRSQLARLVLG
ncbi:helix-turn-helix transcriptional regulator [Duganella sp.]|uniref:helix-turn-helix transcriptional regulator n=1 Tax=Duganella sp. TaxID=1904440 RepID=UPI0031E00F63